MGARRLRSWLVSPLIGFSAAWLLLTILKSFIKIPALYKEPVGNTPPPFWIRGLLILTCTGELSRNRSVGLMLARGISLQSALSDLGHVAEGVYTAPEVSRIAQRLGIDMPITATICQVLFQGLAPAEAVAELLVREPKSEF